MGGIRDAKGFWGMSSSCWPRFGCLIALLFIMSGCAAVVKQQLAALTRSDVETALLLAKDDSDATFCYVAILETLPERDEVVSLEAVGPLSTFQKVRNLRRGVTADIPAEVHRNCAVLVLDAQRTVKRLGLRILRLR